MSSTYFAVVGAELHRYNNQVVYINNLDNSLGWKKALAEKNKEKMIIFDPLKMYVLAKDKTVYVKTQFDEVCLEINDQNNVEVKQVSKDSVLKEYSEKIT